VVGSEFQSTDRTSFYKRVIFQTVLALHSPCVARDLPTVRSNRAAPMRLTLFPSTPAMPSRHPPSVGYALFSRGLTRSPSMSQNPPSAPDESIRRLDDQMVGRRVASRLERSSAYDWNRPKAPRPSMVARFTARTEPDPRLCGRTQRQTATTRLIARCANRRDADDLAILGRPKTMVLAFRCNQWMHELLSIAVGLSHARRSEHSQAPTNCGL